MDAISVNRFRDNLKTLIDRVTTEHLPLKVTRRGSESFIVISEEDWQREQETLHVLQSSDLMRQIGESLQTHSASAGYTPSREEMDEITGF